MDMAKSLVTSGALVLFFTLDLISLMDIKRKHSPHYFPGQSIYRVLCSEKNAFHNCQCLRAINTYVLRAAIALSDSEYVVRARYLFRTHEHSLYFPFVKECRKPRRK